MAGLSLKKKIGNLFSAAEHGLNPFDGGQGWTSGLSNQQKAAQSIQNANQQIKNIQNPKGVLANPQVQQQFISSQEPIGLSKIDVSNVLKNRATGLGLGSLRAGTGWVQGASGLYDLATPGVGTNRFSKGLDRFAKSIDQTAKAEQVGNIYTAGQVGTEGLGFAAPSVAADLLGKTSLGSKIAKPVINANTFIDKIATPSVNATSGQRIAGRAIEGLKPSTLFNVASGVASDLGQISGKGQDVNAKNAALSFGTNVGLGVGVPVAGQIIAEGTKKAGKVGVRGAKAVADTMETPAVAELRARNEFLQKTYDTAPDSVRRELNKQIANNNAEIRSIKEGGYVGAGSRKTTGIEKAVEQIMVEDNIGRDAATQKLDKIIRRDTAPGQELTYSSKPLEQIVGDVKKDPRVQSLLKTFSVSMNKPRVEAALTASKVATKAKQLGIKADQAFIDKYQAGALETDAEKALGKYIKENITDPLFKVQSALDPTIKYRQNYIPQSYAQDSAVVEAAARKLQQQTGAARPRAFSTYKEAAQFGLTPAHKQLDQMLGTNTGSASRALANRKVIKEGFKSGLFTLNPNSGTPLTGFLDNHGQQIYAQKGVADILNGITQRDTSGLGKLLHGAAKASQIGQDIALQGGVPGTNANFFVFGQGVKDTTRNVGKFAIHPIQAVKQEGNLIGDFFRGNASTQARFAKNADFVREMSNRGLYMSPQTSLSGASKNVAERAWDTLGNNPTFGRYMPNRMLSTAQEIYQQSVKKLGHEAALNLAAEQTKAFTGVVDQIIKGRTNLTADGVATAFFAPKYRESIINTLNNVVKSVSTNIDDPNLKASRELALGMAVTLAGYEVLNQKLNGHSMLENRKGQELSIQIPYGPKDAKGNQPVINVPFMPGFMTIPRAIAGAAVSAKGGDVKGVVAEGSKLLSMPLNTAGSVIGNRDYFGRPIYIDPNTANKEGVNPDTAGTVAKKVGAYVAGQMSPAWVRAGMNAAQGKPLEQNIATALEAPVRFGKVTNPDTAAYFDNRDKFYKGLDKNERALFDKINPVKKDITGSDISLDKSKLTTPAKYGDLLANADFTSKYQKYKQSEKNHDPLWDLNSSQLRSFMQAQVIGKNDPGGDSKTVSVLYKRLPSDFFTKREQYFASLKSSGVDLGGSDYTPRPKMPNNLVSFSEKYHNLPYGTGARSAALRSPEGQAYIAYLDQNRVYNNQERADLGLPPLEDPNNKYTGSKKGGSRSRGGGRSKSVNVSYTKTPISVSVRKLTAIKKPNIRVAVKARSSGRKGGKIKVTSKKLRLA